MPDQLVRIDTPAPGVRYIILDDPATRNALGDELLDQLIDALEAARDDSEVRVVVITSSHERIFSSGGNLKAFADDRPVAEKYAGLGRFPRLYTLIGALGKPVICAANGDVLAGLNAPEPHTPNIETLVRLTSHRCGTHVNCARYPSGCP